MLSNLFCVMYTHTHHTCTCTHTHTHATYTPHTHTKYQLLGGVRWRREESTTCWREHSAAKGCRESKNLKPVWTWLFTTAHPNFLLSLSQEQLSVLDSFTGCPLPEDILLYSIPVCAPYTAVLSYKWVLWAGMSNHQECGLLRPIPFRAL